MEQKGTFWLPPQASTSADDIDAIFYFIYWTSVVIMAGVGFFTVYYAWKYRRRSHADRPVEVEPSKALELSWVVIPSVLVLIVFWWSMSAFISASVSPASAYTINVTGKKWLWEFTYPNGKTSVDELYVPVGVPVRLQMTSTDVIHSFFVPAFRVKHDVVPNRYTSVWFEATEPGEYQAYCTEYCGTDHSGMLAVVHAVEQGAFNEWLQAAGADQALPLPELGAQLYTQQACNACHSIDGSPSVGPSWLGTWGQARPLADGGSAVVDADYIRESIVNPNAKVAQGFQPVMPPYPNLSDRQLQGIIAYIQDINGAWTGEAAADTTAAPTE